MQKIEETVYARRHPNELEIHNDGQRTNAVFVKARRRPQGKKVAIVDDVVSTGGSLRGLEQIVNLAGGIIYKKAFVLAEGDAAERDDIVYLAKIPIITD